jgi:hypothetical protein
VGRTKDALNTDPGKPILCDIRVDKRDTLDIWHSPTPRVDTPLHLVVITHGLHSKTVVDMLYIKEKIDEMACSTGENVVIRGYFDNVCRTEKGIKYLGRRLGDYVVKALVPSLMNSGSNLPKSRLLPLHWEASSRRLHWHISSPRNRIFLTAFKPNISFVWPRPFWAFLMKTPNTSSLP